ncbi:MAG: hypothetical protein Q8P84_02170 [Deltaproteobacteria bacterium]|nr:hypothetical protein [Deltaproteobacteria bacterium]
MLAGGEEVKTAGYLGLPSVSRDGFNRVAKQSGYTACWVKDNVHPGTPNPDEIALCDSRKGNLDEYVVMESPSLCAKAIPVDFTPIFNAQYRNVVERLRQELIAKELAKTTVVEIATNLDDYGLNPAQKKMVAAILKAGESMDYLYQLQRGVIHETLHDYATTDDLEFRRRYQTLWCEDKNPLCVADEKMPPMVTPLYPKEINCEKEITGDLANPFSVVNRGLKPTVVPGLSSVPYSKSLLSASQWDASERLRTASIFARDAKEKALADYMDEVAVALLVDKPFPYAEADKKWITAKSSRFFLRIGADEVGNDQGCQTKAMYEMVFGIKNPVAEENISKVTRHNQAMETYLAKLIPGYNPRKIIVETPDVVDVLMMSGEAKGNIKGTMIGQTLPNWCGEDGQAECKTRIMIYTNNTKKSYSKELFTAFERLLSPEVIAHLDPAVIVDKTVLHEIAHNLGPQMKSYTKQIGDMLGRLEELKAEVGGIALQPKLEELGFAKPEERKKLYAGLLAWCLGHIRRAAPRGEKYYEAGSPYQQLAAVVVGHFTEQGAFTYKDDKWDIVWDKAPEAAKALYAKVGEVYLKGDRNAVESFFKQYTSGDGLKHLHLKQVDEAIGLDKVPSPVFTFKVTGLE